MIRGDMIELYKIFAHGHPLSVWLTPTLSPPVAATNPGHLRSDKAIADWTGPISPSLLLFSFILDLHGRGLSKYYVGAVSW